jgi:integrase
MPKVRHKLTDRHISALWDFHFDPAKPEQRGKPIEQWDTEVRGLRLRIGKHRATWSYFAQHRTGSVDPDKGRRRLATTCEVVGYWSPVPNEGVSVRDARKGALRIAGREAEGKVMPGRRDALGFTKAFDDYCAHLHRKAIKAGKKPLWHGKVQSLGKLHMKPKWDGWTLAKMSAAPQQVADWHREVSDKAGDVTGNKCAKVLRAVYRHAKRLDRTLPADLPTSGVTMNPETPREAGMRRSEFREWTTAWRKIESPIRRAYALLACLTGQRPGELARLKWTDILPAERCFVMRKPKAEQDIRVPLSAPIVRGFKMARDAARADKIRSEWMFPVRGGGHLARAESDGLPLWGNGLRHNYKTVATTMMRPAVPELHTDLLQCHTPKGVSRGYVSKVVAAESDALRDAQRRISARMLDLLGLGTADF